MNAFVIIEIHHTSKYRGMHNFQYPCKHINTNIYYNNMLILILLCEHRSTEVRVPSNDSLRLSKLIYHQKKN